MKRLLSRGQIRPNKESKMRKMMMIGAAVAALVGPAKADVYACRHLLSKMDMHAALGQQNSQAFSDFNKRYRTDTIANNPQLMATAKRLANDAEEEAATFADLGEFALADGCVSPADVPKFRQWINEARAMSNQLAETLK
jgi:hypothetical protein